jgi:predicted DNA-binding transcriptional regulator AlpA
MIKSVKSKTNDAPLDLPANAQLGRRLLMPDELPLKGIHLNLSYLRRLWTEGKFPKPVYVTGRRFGWPEEAIDKWIDERIANPTERKEVRKVKV